MRPSASTLPHIPSCVQGETDGRGDGGAAQEIQASSSDWNFGDITRRVMCENSHSRRACAARAARSLGSQRKFARGYSKKRTPRGLRRSSRGPDWFIVAASSSVSPVPLARFLRSGRRLSGASWARTPRIAVASLFLFVSTPAWAHVGFTAPPEDSELVVGSEVEVTWTDLISHDTVAYQLDFYLDKDANPVSVAADIPVSEKHFTWTVPDSPCTECFLFVTQQNPNDGDYTDRLSLSIVAVGSEGSGGAAQGTGGSGEEGVGGAVEGTGGAVEGSGGAVEGSGGAASGGQPTASGGTVDSAGGSDTSTPDTAPAGCSLTTPSRSSGTGSGLAALVGLALVLGRRRRRADEAARALPIERGL